MPKDARSLLLRYGVALASAALAIAMRGLFTPVWGNELPFLTLFPAVLLSAWYGGLGPGIMTTILCATAARYLWLGPSYAHWIGLGGAVLMMSLIAWLTAAMQKAGEGERAQLEYFRVTLASIGDAVIVTDPQGEVTFMNKVAEQATGWRAADCLGKPLSEVFLIWNEETRQPVENPVAQVMRTGVTVGLANHTILRTKDGRELPIDDSAAIIRNEQHDLLGIVLVFRDISERRRAEATLRQSEMRYRTISELVSNYSYTLRITPEGSAVVEWGTESFRRISGFTTQELEAAGGLKAVVHPVDWPLVQERLRSLFAGQPGTSEHRIITKQGAVRWLRDYSAPEWDPAHKRVVRVTGAGQDITMQKRAETQLHDLIRTTQDAVISIDRQGCIDLFNPAAERIFGYAHAEMQGRKVELLMPESYASEHDEYVARYERTGEPRAIGRTRTVTARRKNGEVFPIELSVAEFGVGSDVRYGAFIRDISEKVHLQELLVERERLAAIGTTVAKLAHEIGNPLNGMAVATQLLQRRLDKQRDVLDAKVLTGVQALRREITRLSQLLQEFRSLSRQQQFIFKPTNLHTVVQEIIDAEIALYTERGVRVEQHLSTDLPLIMADGDKLKQVLLNLCKNAVEAMPDGGTLAVRLRNAGERITLEVADTGRGIPAGVDIFEPFVTTKSEGTGLGLPIVRQIMAAHDGILTYTSEAEKGTTFTITLPLALPGTEADKSVLGTPIPLA